MEGQIDLDEHKPETAAAVESDSEHSDLDMTPESEETFTELSKLSEFGINATDINKLKVWNDCS